MKCICIILYILTTHCNLTQAQKIWVIDSLTHKPIEGITMFANQNFYYSDSTGLILPVVSEDDLIWFKRLDYEQKWLNYSTNMDTIRLLKKAIFLSEVETSNTSTQSEYYEIGYHHKDRFFKRTNICNNLCILAVYVPSYHANSYINKILLNIKSRKYAEDYYVYLYEPDSLGSPGKTLYKGHFLADSLKKEGIIDVNELGIKIPNDGIFIGLENTKKYNYEEHHPILGMGVRFEYIESKNANLCFVLLKDLEEKSKSNIWIPTFYDEIPCFGLQVYQKKFQKSKT